MKRTILSVLTMAAGAFAPCIFALVAACTVASSGFAQSKESRFEAVSIKPLGPRGPAPFSGELILPGGMFRDPGTTLRALIEMAYDIEDLGLKIIDLPKWAEAAAYAITAKAGPEYPATTGAEQNQENVKAMLRSMLSDRFQLKIHQEERKTKVLILQVKQGGAKLRPVSAPQPPEKEGRLGMGLGDRRGSFSGTKVTIAQLARILAQFLNQRVEDRTGLTGFYDFNERWEAPYREGDPVPANTLGPDGLAQLVSYLDQNLGLVLKPETVSANFWVVDHVEMPSEN